MAGTLSTGRVFGGPGQGGAVGFRLGADAQVGTEGFGAHGVVLQSIGGGSVYGCGKITARLRDYLYFPRYLDCHECFHFRRFCQIC